MKVQIEGNLYLESDGMQFMIKQYTGKVDKKGNELYTTKGHFSHLHNAVTSLVKMKLMESTATDLKRLLSDLQTIKSDIEAQIYI